MEITSKGKKDSKMDIEDKEFDQMIKQYKSTLLDKDNSDFY